MRGHSRRRGLRGGWGAFTTQVCISGSVPPPPLATSSRREASEAAGLHDDREAVRGLLCGCTCACTHACMSVYICMSVHVYTCVLKGGSQLGSIGAPACSCEHAALHTRLHHHTCATGGAGCPCYGTVMHARGSLCCWLDDWFCLLAQGPVIRHIASNMGGWQHACVACARSIGKHLVHQLPSATNLPCMHMAAAGFGWPRHPRPTPLTRTLSPLRLRPPSPPPTHTCKKKHACWIGSAAAKGAADSS